MSDHETSVLSSRLTELADELAPAIDALGQVDGARMRYRRIRQVRITVASAAVAVAVAAVGVPTAVGALAGPSSGEVARTAPSTATATAISEEEQAARSAAEEAARAADGRLDAEQAARQAARSQLIADALADRDPPLDLRAGTDRSCPDAAARLTEALGVDVRTDSAGDPVAGCRWSGGTLALVLSLVPGQTKEEMVREVDRSVSVDGCYPRAMPSTVELTPLTLCPAGDGTAWTLRVPDSTGAGYWVLAAEEGAGAAPDAGASGLLALVDAAAARW